MEVDGKESRCQGKENQRNDQKHAEDSGINLKASISNYPKIQTAAGARKLPKDLRCPRLGHELIRSISSLKPRQSLPNTISIFHDPLILLPEIDRIKNP